MGAQKPTVSKPMAAPRHVAIVGCGFTGTSALHQLVESYPVRAVTIFEKTGDFGPGYPYRTWEAPDYLINNTADTMGIVPENRRAFLRWLEGRPDLAPNPEPTGHYPRAFFGWFLKDAFEAAARGAETKGIALHLVPQEVVDIEEMAEGVLLHGAEGETHAADVAILTTGRCPDRDAYGPPKDGMTCRYYPSHIPGAVLDDVPLDATCHVLGASLSAYDAVNKLFAPDSGCRFERDAEGGLRFVANGNQRRVLLCSRSGRLKKMQSRHPGEIDRRHFTTERVKGLEREGRMTLERLAALAAEDAAAAGWNLDWEAMADPYAGCASAEAVTQHAADILERDIAAARDAGDTLEKFKVDYLNDAKIALWDAFATGALSLDDELAYRRHFETTLLTYFAACPISTAERVLALIGAGRLEVRRGVTEVALNEVEDCHDIATEHGVEKARVLINTTGSVDRRVASAAQAPVTARLRERGLLRPYVKEGREMNGLAIDMESFLLEGSTRIYAANQFLWGPGFFVSSAYMMGTIVSRLFEQMFAAERARG